MRGLSVIIPSRSVTNLVACIDQIRGFHAEPPRTIVVDDGLKAKVFGPDCQIAGDKPFIFARNVNIAIRYAGADDVILLNDDALLETFEGFAKLQRAAAEHPEYGVIAARTDAASCPIQTAKFRGMREVARAVAFVCVYIPRAVIDEVGLLDERFTGSIDGEMVYGGEDDDYCYRVRQAGYKIGVLGDVFVNHTALESTFRGRHGSLPINATRARFQEIHGFEMGMR